MGAFFETLLAARDIRDPLLPLWLMESLASVFLYAWLFALGATVGSFLNVVVYRLPRGKNLAFPGSACPRCGHPIRLTDNIPILSWLALAGRCRDCGGAISARYFMVESLVASTFLVVLAGEQFLPIGAFGDAARRPLSPHDGAEFWCLYGLHLSLVTTLLAAVLIAADGFRVPGKLFAPVMLAAVLFSLVWPAHRSAHVGRPSEMTDWPFSLADSMAGGSMAMFGLAVGAALGLAGVAVERRLWGERLSIAPLAAASCIGVTFGWQRALWLAPLTLLICWLGSGLLRATASAVVVGEQAVSSTPAQADLASAPSNPVDDAIISAEVHIVSPPSEHLDQEPS